MIFTVITKHQDGMQSKLTSTVSPATATTRLMNTSSSNHELFVTTPSGGWNITTSPRAGLPICRMSKTSMQMVLAHSRMQDAQQAPSGNLPHLQAPYKMASNQLSLLDGVIG